MKNFQQKKGKEIKTAPFFGNTLVDINLEREGYQPQIDWVYILFLISSGAFLIFVFPFVIYFIAEINIFLFAS